MAGPVADASLPVDGTDGSVHEAGGSVHGPQGRAVPRRRSLRRRLLGSMFLAFAALVAIIALLIWSYARTAADRSYDLLLAGAALSMLERVSAGADGVTVDVPYSALEMVGLAREDRIAYAVRGARAGLLTGMEGLPEAPEARGGRSPTFHDARHGGEVMRFVSQSRDVSGPSGRERVTVTIGQTRRARNAQALDLFVNGVAGLAAVSLIGLIFVWLAIRRALQPLHAIERDLRAREPTDLTRLGMEPPREVEGLIGSINGFMERLRLNREQTETFIADVAHQTRTALTALHGQLTLARDARDDRALRDRLARAEDQAERSVRLTNQLLSHAMVIHRAEGEGTVEGDLHALARDLLSELVRDTGMRDLDVTLDADEGERFAVRGDAISIREALRNLVENAVRHAGGAKRLEVSLAREEPRVVLSVSDAGPGIPEAEREAVLERFRGLDRAGRVSGLGLAIVKAVADAHGAALSLDRSVWGGLRATLRFPAAMLALLAVLAATPEGRAGERLVVWSATDTAAMRTVVSRFETVHPGIGVEYVEFQTKDLHAAVIAGGRDAPDVVISSAMDLQFDLVNRGLARPVAVSHAVPEWASWRSELFGFTHEPAVMIYARERLDPASLPRTHRDLPAFLRDNEGTLAGRVATYDIARSGIGYLYATQDSAQERDFLRTAEALGRAGVELVCCTSRMIDGIAGGELLLGTNAIGSYALAAARKDPRIGIHLFEDYNLVMTRTAFVHRDAARPEWGGRFVDYLLSPLGQRTIEETSGLLPLSDRGIALASSDGAPGRDGAPDPVPTYLPIRLSAGLLAYLDRLKREDFLASWREAVRAPRR